MSEFNKKYVDYFDVDESYIPCVDESAIEAGSVNWKTTYPHTDFIKLLKECDRMLSGSTKRSLWIHGAYGTGKSHCAYAMQQILETSEEELTEYWNRYEALRQNHQPLLQSLLGHKGRGIVTAYRYASGSIHSIQQLCYAVQETISDALNKKGLYKGDNTLKEGVIAWLQDSDNNAYINSLLLQPKWQSLFSQSTADQIINSLQKSSDVTSLMSNIFKLADERGIKALKLSTDSLKKWLIDVVRTNDIRLVFVWDEFSDFFRQNPNTLSDFQELVAICQEAPFYFVIVTHPVSSLSLTNNSWSIARQRFEVSEISMPGNIAFDLIADAFKVKSAALSEWQAMSSDLFSRLPDAVNAVKKTESITNDSVMRKILPIHPMAALALEKIATAYKANQRSMFDFIKTKEHDDEQAFQWFINNFSPLDDRPFLTIDMLWDFFYEKGKDSLDNDTRRILDVFNLQTQLDTKEKVVLKTILIMQAILQGLNKDVDLLAPTDQNLKYAFAGDIYEMNVVGIANGLKSKGILIPAPTRDGKQMYVAAVLAGDGKAIDEYKKKIRAKTTIQTIAQNNLEVGAALGLTPALRLRFSHNVEIGAIKIITKNDLDAALNASNVARNTWQFNACLAVAISDEEAGAFRKAIRDKMSTGQYLNITIIDALSTPLGHDALEDYINNAAFAEYYQSNNNKQANESSSKAKNVIGSLWRKRIEKGDFYVYTSDCPSGERKATIQDVHAKLQEIVRNKFPYVQDFTNGLTEPQLKLTQVKTVSRIGVGDLPVSGLIKGCEKSVLKDMWNHDQYWFDSNLVSHPIVIVKKAVDELIKKHFDKEGKIDLNAILMELECQFGYAPCNLYAFIIGFILKEYCRTPYKYMNAEGHRDDMTPDKLAEMIGNCLGKTSAKSVYIVSLTEEEKAFYELVEKVWRIDKRTCSSPQQTGVQIQRKMKTLIYPVWCLDEVDSSGNYQYVALFSELVQADGDKAHDIANKLGAYYTQNPGLADNLIALITVDNCKEGMKRFLSRYNGGQLVTLANEIGAQNIMLTDVSHIFETEFSALWIPSTGTSELDKLIEEYQFVKATNELLNVNVNNKADALEKWRECWKFAKFSNEAICNKYAHLNTLFSYMMRVVRREDLLPDNIKVLNKEMQQYHDDISAIIANKVKVFAELYRPYLEDVSELDCEKISNSIQEELFTMSATHSNETVKNAVENYRKKQLKTQLIELWQSKTASKTPLDWSMKHLMPILVCVENEDYNNASCVFNTINNQYASDREIKEAIAYFNDSTLFDKLADTSFCDKMFETKVLGKYAQLLTDRDKVRDKLERTGIHPYYWNTDPSIKARIRDLALAEYNAGGSDKVVAQLNSMSDSELKSWLTSLVKQDVELGLQILNKRR